MRYIQQVKILLTKTITFIKENFNKNIKFKYLNFLTLK